jgi:hypothetical protein
MAQQMFVLGEYFLGDSYAVHFNPGGRFHGWLFRRGADGQWVSVARLTEVPLPFEQLREKPNQPVP